MWISNRICPHSTKPLKPIILPQALWRLYWHWKRRETIVFPVLSPPLLRARPKLAIWTFRIAFRTWNWPVGFDAFRWPTTRILSQNHLPLGILILVPLFSVAIRAFGMSDWGCCWSPKVSSFGIPWRPSLVPEFSISISFTSWPTSVSFYLDASWR